MKSIEKKLYSAQENFTSESGNVFSGVSQFQRFIKKNVNTILVAATVATGVAATSDNRTIQKEDTQPSHQIVQKGEKQNNICDIWEGLGYVDKDNNAYICKESISKTAERYSLDKYILTVAIEQNEIGSSYFKQISDENEYNKGNNIFSYRQLGEVLGDIHTLKYLSEQQLLSNDDKIQSQRIFNELLRGKIEWNDNYQGEVSNEYEFIHEIANYIYTDVFGEEYTSDGMIRVTRRIDQGYYDESVLFDYLNQMKDYISYYGGFDIGYYEQYVDSQVGGEMIVKNDIK